MKNKNLIKTIIAIAFFAALLGAGIWENFHVKKIFRELDQKIEKLKTEIEEENLDASKSSADELIVWWEKNRRLLETIVFAPDLRLFSVSLGEIKGSLAAEDFQNAASKVESLLSISRNLCQLLDFNLSDII
ncbi:MAG: DUF4363 family protein [Clostridiaceae bacterium]|jgi:HPt (histidine-containing phosphotransfer) domain-containing protein|nr:DUF4363 family protein [Clostridiaceae bacterium]